MDNLDGISLIYWSLFFFKDGFMCKKTIFRFLIIFSVVAAAYGAGRLYYYLTGGFTENNIISDFAYNPEWDVRPLEHNEVLLLEKAMDQPYYYLGKGCQAYVFVSQDRQFVIKFFKYQRYRLQKWLEFFPPLPSIVKYREEKKQKKWNKLDGFVKSWKIAFEHLKNETGLIFVHLNKTNDLHKEITIFDKIGQLHSIDLDKMEFCIQRRADMLCDRLMQFKEKGDLKGAQELIVRLLNMIVSEYHRGLADNDHALMQNTGVLSDGTPVHIDVGQFVINDQVQNSSVYNQELFTKTYKFKIWLRENYPELATFLEESLQWIIGEEYATMKPKFRLKK